MFECFKAKIAGMYRSMTIWFNSLVGMVVIGLPEIKYSFPELQSYLPEGFFRYAMGALIIGNIFLRFKTNKGLQDK